MLAPAVQVQVLETAATAIALIESRALLPRGEHATLFLTEPQIGFTNGLPEKKPKLEPVNHWQRAAQAINEARHNPGTARSLFALASYGRHDPNPWNACGLALPTRDSSGISVTLRTMHALCIP